jgi:hypothetical protein
LLREGEKHRKFGRLHVTPFPALEKSQACTLAHPWPSGLPVIGGSLFPLVRIHGGVGWAGRRAKRRLAVLYSNNSFLWAVFIDILHYSILVAAA